MDNYYTYYFYIKAAIHVACFCLAFYSLNALHFEKALRQGRVFQAQLLYILISFGLGYLSAQFIIALIYQLNVW